MTLPVLAITPGEPAGIGPECALRLAADHPDLRLLFVADPDLMSRSAERLGLNVSCSEWHPGRSVQAGQPMCCPVPLMHVERPGRLDQANAGYVLATLKKAISLVQENTAQALVTGPVHKGVINDAGIPFSGHTEFLAELAGRSRVVMLLAAEPLRVALVTTHLPLRAVAEQITAKRVLETLQIVDHDLREHFGFTQPRIQVLGLNPHAGEGGHLGREDLEEIQPAIESANAQGIRAYGPVPADTAFNPPALERCDVVLAMYHDQGLPVLKHAGFGRAVNVTLGLPFVRTSVDHGTALDIAGRGIANAESFFHAAEMALKLTGGH